MSADAKGNDHGRDPLIHIQEHLMKEERFLEGLTEEEQKLYETCKSMLYSLSENGNLEEACEWLEKLVSERNDGSTEDKEPSD
jgi:pentatricopeptide repeat protein